MECAIVQSCCGTFTAREAGDRGRAFLVPQLFGPPSSLGEKEAGACAVQLQDDESGLDGEEMNPPTSPSRASLRRTRGRDEPLNLDLVLRRLAFLDDVLLGGASEDPATCLLAGAFVFAHRVAVVELVSSPRWYSPEAG